jgi:NADH-quinone oxidoreductase subunit M
VQQFKFDMFKLNNLLLYILLFPIFGILTLLLIPAKEEKMLKLTALNFSIFSFIGSLILWGFFQKSIGAFQFVVKFFWLPSFKFKFTLGIDGISIFFLLLTTLLIPLCIFTSWNSVNKNIKRVFNSFFSFRFFFNWNFLCIRFITFLYFF